MGGTTDCNSHEYLMLSLLWDEDF